MSYDSQQTNILGGLRETHDKRKQLDERITSMVAAARAYGVSWQQIGQALDMSKQSAWGRFGDLDKRVQPTLSFLAVRGQLESWIGQRVRVLGQSPYENAADYRFAGRLECDLTADVIACWVGGRRADRRFMIDATSFRDAHPTEQNGLIVDLSGGSVEVCLLEPLA
jgi:hypothetical protein